MSRGSILGHNERIQRKIHALYIPVDGKNIAGGHCFAFALLDGAVHVLELPGEDIGASACHFGDKLVHDILGAVLCGRKRVRDTHNTVSDGAEVGFRLP